MQRLTVVLLLLLSSCLSPLLYAQNEDSLRNVIAHYGTGVRTDTLAASTHLELAELLLLDRPQEAISNLKNACDEFKRFKYVFRAAYCYSKIGNAYARLQLYGLAMENYLTASRMYEDLHATRELNYSLLDIGMVYYRQQRYTSARGFFDKAGKAFMEMGDARGLAFAYDHMGINLREAGNIDSAYICFGKALVASRNMHDKSLLAQTLYYLGTVFQARQQYDSSKYYLTETYNIILRAEKNEDEDYVLLGKALTRLAAIAINIGDLPAAESYYKKAVNATVGTPRILNYAISLYNLGAFYSRTGRIKDALAVLNQALAVETKYQFLKEEYSSRQLLVSLYAKKGDLKNELLQLRIVATLSDSLSRLNSQQRLSDLKNMAEMLGKEKEIETLKEKNKAEKIFLFSLVLIFLMLGLVLYYRFRALKKNESFFNHLTNSLFEGLLVSVDGLIVECNDKLLDLSGFSKSQLIGQPTVQFIADDIEREAIRNSLSNDPKGEFRLALRAVNGRAIMAEISIRPFPYKRKIGRLVVIRDITEKIEAERTIANTKMRLETAIEQTPTPMLLVSAIDKCFLVVNTAFKEYLEIPGETEFHGLDIGAISKNWVDICPDGSLLPPDEKPLNRVLQGIEVRNQLLGVITQSGKKKWEIVNASPIYSTEGELLAAFMVCTDITESREIAEKLHQSEALYRSILAASPDPILILTLEGNISFISPSGLKLFDADVQEMMGRPYLEFILEEDRERIMIQLEMLMIRGVPGSMECRVVLKTGEVISLEANAEAITGSSGDVTGIAVALRDVSERKRFEEMLIANEERLTKIMDLMPFPILLTGIKERNVLYVNQACADTFLVDQAAVVGKAVSPFYADNEQQVAFIKDLITNGSVRDREILFKKSDGSQFWGRMSSLRNKIGEDTVIISGVVDITAQKEAALQLIEAKNEADRANRAKSEFLANMSHEIRTPMNAILGFAELVKRRKLDEVSADYIDGIEKGGRSLLTLINDILDLSKIEAGKLDIQYYPSDVRSVCEDLFKIFEYQASIKNIGFQHACTSHGTSVLLMDEVRLRQILFNLLGNAVKFTHRGFVSCNVAVEPSVSDAGGYRLSIEVKDTGIGIQDSEKERIFQAFHQQEGQSARKYGGTGLGLTITRRLTKLMNGDISFVSAPGEGTVFTVVFDKLKPAIIEVPDHTFDEYVETLQFSNEKILIVEDNESNRRVVRGYLEPHNIQLYEAPNGEEGCVMAEKLVPDLILMDLQMPIMDGYEAIKNIRTNEITKHIPIVIVTASVLQGDKVKVQALAEGYLHKPLSKNVLMQELMKYLKFSIPDENTLPAVEPEPEEEIAYMELSADTIGQLKNFYLPRLTELLEGMVIDEIQETASNLQKLPGASKKSELYIRSAAVFRSAETFDTLQIETALQKLIAYIQTL